MEGLKHDFRTMGTVTAGSNDQRARIGKILTQEEREYHRKTIFTNVAFSKPVSANFAKSALALPTTGSAVYSHMFAGLTNYVLARRGGAGGPRAGDENKRDISRKLKFDATKGSPFYRTPTFYRDEDFLFANYYRSPILVEELARMGYSEGERNEAIAKAFFLQYWSGGFEKDPLVFNPLVRVFYPQGAHVVTGSNDLGYF